MNVRNMLVAPITLVAALLAASVASAQTYAGPQAMERKAAPATSPQSKSIQPIQATQPAQPRKVERLEIVPRPNLRFDFNGVALPPGFIHRRTHPKVTVNYKVDNNGRENSAATDALIILEWVGGTDNLTQAERKRAQGTRAVIERDRISLLCTTTCYHWGGVEISTEDLQLGVWKLTIKLDPDNNVVESDETDNSHTIERFMNIWW